MIRVLYDGWPLVRQPNSPEALHLLALLEQHPAEVEAHLALPEEPSDWIPPGVTVHVSACADGLRHRLVWEQQTLPRLAESLRFDLLHLTTSNPPLFGRRLSVVSPAEAPPNRSSAGFTSRFTENLRRAVSSGGMSRLRGVFWPEDLASHPPSGVSAPIFHLPPLPPQVYAFDGRSSASRTLLNDQGLNLPESYILCRCPLGPLAIRRMLDAWSWAAGPIGEYYPLLLLEAGSAASQFLNAVIEEYRLGDTVRPLPALSPNTIPALVQGCSAVFHPSSMSPWETITRLALLYGKPLVAAAGNYAAAIAGPAAYLALVDDSRTLGAGLITVIVEEGVAQSLSQAGRMRSDSWNRGGFASKLASAYKSALESQRG